MINGLVMILNLLKSLYMVRQQINLKMLIQQNKMKKNKRKKNDFISKVFGDHSAFFSA